jgi:protein-disulfide isomerase
VTASSPQTQPPSALPKRQGEIRIKKSWALAAGLSLVALLIGGGAATLITGGSLFAAAGPGAPMFDSKLAPPALGPDDAPVTVKMFSDFYCVYCKQWHDQTFQALMSEYPTQIRLEYYDFPTSGGQYAAEAANCAREQGAYWEYHNALYSNPHAYSSADQFVSLAGTFDLNETKFRDCVATAKYRDVVGQGYQLGVSYGVKATPTFVINGVMLVGAQPLSEFERVINQQLLLGG